MLKHINLYEFQLPRKYNTKLAAGLQLNKHVVLDPV
jgi:hypothetical protein